MAVDLEFDLGKRARTLIERDLDFARAGEIFAGPTLTRRDEREDYGEDRYITVGLLDAGMVVVVWTPRGETRRRIISLRKANAREEKRYAKSLG